MVYSRWTRYRKKADVPLDAKCCCLVAKTSKPCDVRPSYFVHGNDVWACGRHLQKSLPECTICMCNMSKCNTKIIPCGHAFHDKCLSKWERTIDYPTCPICRAAYFTSGWIPHLIPPDVKIWYDNTDYRESEHTRVLTESLLMEIATYHYITQPTVKELLRMCGSDWYVSLGSNFCAPVMKDGTVVWSQLNEHHQTAKLLQRLEASVGGARFTKQ